MIRTTWKEVPVAKLDKAPWNYKGEDAVIGDRLRASLKRQGQIVNLIVRPMPRGRFEVVNGNHRLDKLRELMVQTAVCCVVDVNESVAKRIALQTNELSFSANLETLSAALHTAASEIPWDELRQSIDVDAFKGQAYDWNALAASRAVVPTLTQTIAFTAEQWADVKPVLDQIGPDHAAALVTLATGGQ